MRSEATQTGYVLMATHLDSLEWVEKLLVIASVERIVHDLGARVLVERVVRGVGTSTSQTAGGNDGSSHNSGDDTSGQTTNDGAETSEAVQGLVVASSGSTELTTANRQSISFSEI